MPFTPGSYGSLPLPVLAECERLALLAERNPDLFNRVTYMPLLDQARCVLCSSATMVINPSCS